MTGRGGLSRQIVNSMVVMSLAVTILGILGSYVFYGVSAVYFPQLLSAEESLVPTPFEVGWMVCTAAISMGVAFLFAIRLSRRILKPLNSVADSLRQVADGNLEARAGTDDQSLGEAAQLVSDFNEMAARLYRVEQERKFWNAAIAHELRTPLTILRGRLQGLTDGVFQPDNQLFHNLLTQVEGLGRIVDDLRIVGLADNGKLDLQLATVDVASEVQAVIQATQHRLQEAGLQISTSLDHTKVLCDPVRIRQSVLALLENTILHANAGPIQVQVRVNEGSCRVSVEDCGPGIDPAKAQKLFDAFQRGDTKGKGNGLGLAVVKAIAQSHGGDAGYEPSKTGGSVFFVHWPEKLAIKPNN